MAVIEFRTVRLHCPPPRESDHTESLAVDRRVQEGLQAEGGGFSPQRIRLQGGAEESRAAAGTQHPRDLAEAGEDGGKRLAARCSMGPRRNSSPTSG